MFDEFEYCIICGKRTEKVGLLDDSLYIGEIGPLCGDCYEKSGIIELEAENELAKQYRSPRCIERAAEKCHYGVRCP